MSLNGRHLLVAADIWPPYFWYEKDSNGIEAPFGIAFEILHAVSLALNFTYSFKPAEDGLWGSVLPNGTVKGILGLASRQEVDFALGPFAITYDRSKVVHFSTAFYVDSYGIFLPRPRLENNLASFLNPFTNEVWIILSLSVAVCIFIGIFAFQKLSLKIFTNAGSNETYFKFEWIFQILSLEPVTVVPNTNSSKLFLGSWFVGGFFLTVAYTSVLTSLLTVPKVSIPVNSLKELLEDSSIPIGTEKDTALYQVFKAANSGLYHEVGLKMRDVRDCVRDSGRISQDGWAIICDVISMKSVMSEEFTKNSTCSYYIANEPIYLVSLAFAFPKQSPLTNLFNKWIKHQIESGLVEKIVYKSYSNVTACLRPPGSDRRREAKVLTLKNFIGTFLILIAGYLIGFLLFLKESYFHPLQC